MWFGACKNHFKKKRKDPEAFSKGNDAKLFLICERCELFYLNKLLQERFLEKKTTKEKILNNLQEKFQQTSENFKQKRHMLEILEKQVTK